MLAEFGESYVCILVVLCCLICDTALIKRVILKDDINILKQKRGRMVSREREVSCLQKTLL